MKVNSSWVTVYEVQVNCGKNSEADLEEGELVRKEATRGFYGR